MAKAIIESVGGSGGIDPEELTATSDDVLEGKIAGVNGSDVPVEGTLVIQSILNFKASLYGSGGVQLTWANPAKGPYCGVYIIYKEGVEPNDRLDGTLVYEGAANSCEISGLSIGSTFYFTAYSYINTNHGIRYSSRRITATATPKNLKGDQIFTSSETFIVPEGITSIDVFLVGGGGSGGAGGNGGGGGGGYTKTQTLSVASKETLNVVVGAGGTACIYKQSGCNYSYGNMRSNHGKPSQILRGSTVLAQADGGRGPERKSGLMTGSTHHNSEGGNGGSGGGPGNHSGISLNGGSNGSGGGDGQSSSSQNPPKGGKGQGTTTRAWGETSGTLYSGGGGGADTTTSRYGVGGSGGGGAGAAKGGNGGNGTPNTGSGGGSSDTKSTTSYSGAGGSGIVLIRWGY